LVVHVVWSVICVRMHTITFEWQLLTFDLDIRHGVNPDPLSIVSVGQGHRSKFTAGVGLRYTLWSEAVQLRPLANEIKLELDTHYPCPRAMFTGRVHGREHGCHFWHGPWTRVVCVELKEADTSLSRGFSSSVCFMQLVIHTVCHFSAVFRNAVVLFGILYIMFQKAKPLLFLRQFWQTRTHWNIFFTVIIRKCLNNWNFHVIFNLFPYYLILKNPWPQQRVCVLCLGIS